MRKVAKLSQTELGSCLSIHQSTVCRIENGTQTISAEELFKLASFFKVGMDALITGEIDFWLIAKTFKQLPPFPERYRLFPFTKVREVLPILKFMKQFHGKAFVTSSLKSLKQIPGY